MPGRKQKKARRFIAQIAEVLTGDSLATSANGVHIKTKLIFKAYAN